MRFDVAAKVAPESGIPEYRIRQMIKEGIVPGFYAGRKYFINVDAFLEMLQQMGTANVAANNK